jgi:hypothetical protein
MSIGASKRVRTKRELYTNGVGGFRDDLQQYFRSNWEANFARILNFQNRTWLYEHQTFQLIDNVSYTPDFYLPSEDTFYEIKGRMDERSKLQIQLMNEYFAHVKLTIIGPREYHALRKQYKSLINWEGR